MPRNSSLAPIDSDALLELCDVPFSCRDRSQALMRITALGREAMGSRACTLTLLDFQKRHMTLEALDGFDEPFQKQMRGRTILIDSPSLGASITAMESAQLVERYDLQHDGGGVANPEIARKYDLRAALCQPLVRDRQAIGYFNHFSATERRFTRRDRRLIEILARHATLAIDQFERLRMYQRTLSTLNTLSEQLLAVTPEKFLTQLLRAACDLLSVPVCIVWKADEQRQRLHIVSTTDSVDDEYRKIELRLDDQAVKEWLAKKRVACLPDVTVAHPWYRHAAEAKARGWVSLLTAQMRVGPRLIGMLDVYSQTTRRFTEREKESFLAFANYAALSLGTFAGRERLENLNDLLREMTDSRDVDALLRLMLDRGLGLVGASRGWVSRLDYQTGELQIVDHRGDPPTLRSLQWGNGITWRALSEKKAWNVSDVRAPELAHVYEEFWSDTVSELAVPILIENAAIRRGRDVSSGSKPIGVLNIESERAAAFSEADVAVAESLTQQAAVLIDRLELGQKVRKLVESESRMVGQRDHDVIMDTMLRTVIDVLDYHYVNVSEVDQVLNRIKTTHVAGFAPEVVERFRRMADHSLDSDDIQAHIVRANVAEVPAQTDARFDQMIFNMFNHADLTRVFVPMRVPPDNRVTGTVEAGYRRRFHKDIYEADVQLLQEFVNYATLVLEQHKGMLLEPICHELRAPIVGIRSHASLLRERFNGLTSDLIRNKLTDILTDGETLLRQVSELEYALAMPSTPTPRRTIVMRDVVIKGLRQLEPLVMEQHFPAYKLEYSKNDIGRLVLYVDPNRLNQVVMNLLTNSIKYAESKSHDFVIKVEVDETPDDFVVKFKDWGMGVRVGYEEKIFADGFRAPEAIRKHVTGSGLGLTIARRMMREMNGDLLLKNRRKPTEFHLLLPKSLKEAPSDTHA